MKKRHTKNIMIVVAVLLVYILLLAALVECEKGQPGSQINSLGDAIWYSLVTLSTVGYGDITPSTPAGYLIGAVFLVLSMGLLLALLGSVVSFMTSEGFPMLRLTLARSNDWNYFADFTAESDALARSILEENPDAVIIFGVNKDIEGEKPDYPCFFINVTPSRIVALKKGVGNKCRLFFLRENDIGKNLKAVDVHKLNADVYACTTSGQEKMSGNINFFHTYDCTARSYWREHPLQSTDDNIVLIGFGNSGQALLERAILTNINDTDFDVTYHVFGDASRFRQIHNCLNNAFGINERRPGHDSIFFHEEGWSEAHDTINTADRIIICEDDETEGWDIMWQLQRYYMCRGKIYLRSNRTAPGVLYFGTNEKIFTVDQIIRTRLNDAARVMNDLYRMSVEDSLDWDELSDQLRQSKIAATDHLYMKVRILLKEETVTSLTAGNCTKAYEEFCRAKKDPAELDRLRQIEHARWTRFYTYYNWTYGKEKSSELHQNPMLCEYEMLTKDQKAYHDRAWELIGEVAKILH